MSIEQLLNDAESDQQLVLSEAIFKQQSGLRAKYAAVFGTHAVQGDGLTALRDLVEAYMDGLMTERTTLTNVSPTPSELFRARGLVVDRDLVFKSDAEEMYGLVLDGNQPDGKRLAGLMRSAAFAPKDATEWRNAQYEMFAKTCTETNGGEVRGLCRAKVAGEWPKELKELTGRYDAVKREVQRLKLVQ